jgi:hypothetical protein
MNTRTDLRSYAGEHEPPFNLPRVQDGEPRSVLDSWPFWICAPVIVCAIYVARAWGWI